ncbi:MAG: glycosyltransferase family 2 protein [Anaerolineae bacterium]
MKILTIIPAYNEAPRIGRVVAGVRAALPGTDIVVVNDGSRDETADCAQAAGAHVVSLPFNLGYGVALQTGYKYALAHYYDYALQMDADGQHEAGDLPRLLAVVQADRADVAIGSRFLNGGNYQAPLARRVGMRVFAAVASGLTHTQITDPTSGFQALNRRVLKYYASPAYPVDYPDADVLIMLHYAGFRFVEVPVTMYPASTGKSMHSGLKPLYYVFKMFLSIFMVLLRGRQNGW